MTGELPLTMEVCLSWQTGFSSSQIPSGVGLSNSVTRCGRHSRQMWRRSSVGSFGKRWKLRSVGGDESDIEDIAFVKVLEESHGRLEISMSRNQLRLWAVNSVDYSSTWEPEAVPEGVRKPGWRRPFIVINLMAWVKTSTLDIERFAESDSG